MVSAAGIVAPQPTGNVTPAKDNNFVNPEGFMIKFPPYPHPPKGTEIIAFKDFVEGGICIEPDSEDAEVDTFGIKTVQMKVEHKGDVCKTNTKRKRRADESKARKAAGEKEAKKEWWELWELAESVKYATHFDPNSTRFQRVQDATFDFTKDRIWPPQTMTETGPKYIWEKFLRYIGLPEGYSPIAELTESKKKKRIAREEENDDDSMSDDSDNEDGDAPPVSSHDNSATGNVEVPAPDKAPKKKAMTNEDKLAFFLDNPEECVKIFMSSYAYSKGYVWSEPNLLVIPRLLSFFVNFLIRSKVLPEHDRSLKATLAPIATALVELPNSAAIMKILPDKFGDGCKGCWGTKADGYTYVPAEPMEPSPAPADTPEKPQAKKQKLDDALPGPSNAGGGWGNPGGNTGWGANDNNLMQTDEPPVDAWGNPSGGWNIGSDKNDNPTFGSWGTPGDDTPADTEEPTNFDFVSGWDVKKPEQPHFHILGPTVLPLTHNPAVVERSMRRIKAIVPPNPNPPKSPPAPEGGPDALAIEIELDRHLSKLILGPMIDWDGGEAPVYTRPKILATSQGPVAQDNSASTSKDVAPPEGGSGPKPHDPLNDDITALIGTEQAALLREGMGVAGTWVQVVRKEGQVKKKKKSKAKKATVYWYLEEAAFLATSYWSVNT